MRGGQLARQFDFSRYPMNLAAAKSFSQKTECLMLCNEIYKEIFIHGVLQGDFILIFEETLVASKVSK